MSSEKKIHTALGLSIIFIRWNLWRTLAQDTVSRIALSDCCKKIREERGYVGVFVDGKAVDFSEYEDELEELKEFTGEGPDAIIGVSFPNVRAFGMGRLNGDIFRTCHSYEELEKTAERVEMSLEEELLILFALEDGFERLKDEDAERISVLNFGVSEEELNMAYSEFYFDKEWD